MLHSLAESGMRAWDCSTDMLDSLDGAFENITFKALSIAALERLAATANEKINLSASVQTPPKPTAAQTDVTRIAPNNRVGNAPHRRSTQTTSQAPTLHS